ncbi:NADPH:quinone reductase-like Zn-dependent oxidoreductase [Pseudorhizobium tarimense]|uniref:NADPH:quinone reductase-like Zn-dependent oxidoreductase n=1 Tax=Pseudorhizobium tarimense TaxID=1079109 RepID=A0ABV2H1B0_9HYPH
MSALMKAAVVREFRKPLVIEEMPIPEPGHGQILVKYEVTGVCHADLHAAKRRLAVKPSPPFIPGHEDVGFVAKLGAACRASRKVNASASPGCTPPAAAAHLAAPAGKRCAAASRIPAISSMAPSRSMVSPIPI